MLVGMTISGLALVVLFILALIQLAINLDNHERRIERQELRDETWRKVASL